MPKPQEIEPQAMPNVSEMFPGADEAFQSSMSDWDGDAESAPDPVALDDADVQPEIDAADDAEVAPVVDSEHPEPAVDADAGKARRAAKLAGLPESVIAKASDAELVEWYSSHARSKADVDRAFRENAEFRRELEEMKAAKGAEHMAVPAASEDLELVEKLSRELGPELGKDLANRLSARDREVARKLERAEALEAALEQRLARNVWDGVSRKLGIEGQPDAYEKVVAQVRELAKGQGPWSSLQGDAAAESIFTAAARIVMPTLPSDSELRRRAAISEARRNGTPTAAPQRAAPKKPLNQDEIADAKLAAILRGERNVEKLSAIGS